MQPNGLVIFDCDGVLVDSELISLEVLREVVRSKGVEIPLETIVDRFLGRSLAHERAVLGAEYGVTLTDADIASMSERLYALFKRELQPIKGVSNAISQLTGPRCVASSSLPERIALSLQATGLAGFFGRNIYSATQVARGKPAPDLFLFAADQMRVKPEHAVVIEDSPAGIEAAKAAGMRVLGFVGGSHMQGESMRQRIAALKPDLVFDDMRALPGLLATRA